MGMDVYGRRPSAPAGKYFRANIWSWNPIHALIIDLCADLLDEHTLEGLGYNDGAGPRDQQTCTQMAHRFERWMEQHVSGLTLESDLQITAAGQLLSDEELANDPQQETYSPFHVADEHLQQWIEFLRHCGGFEVW